MINSHPTIVLRHRKENVRKCSLTGLETRPDFRFFTYPTNFLSLPSLNHYVLLSIDAPPLTLDDCSSGLFLIDATWRYAKIMQQALLSTFNIPCRSIPSAFRTAYPRKQTDCPNPEQGLASFEALYVAYKLLGRNAEGLLGNYHWRESFLQSNQQNFECVAG